GSATRPTRTSARCASACPARCRCSTARRSGWPCGRRWPPAARCHPSRSSPGRTTSIRTCPRATRSRSSTGLSPWTATSRSPPRAAGRAPRLRLARIHLEEDAGKLLHEGFPWSGEKSGVDLNRAGVPLIEIVSHPDLRSSEEAHAYLSALKAILVYAGVSECNMEEGSLRCDANVSIRPRGQEALGTRVEVKTLNSFRNVARAIDHEVARQAAVLESGGRVVLETRLWNADRGETASMRSKEEAPDYRYFPEPDLPPLAVSREWVEEVRAELP